MKCHLHGQLARCLEEGDGAEHKCLEKRGGCEVGMWSAEGRETTATAPQETLQSWALYGLYRSEDCVKTINGNIQ